MPKSGSDKKTPQTHIKTGNLERRVALAKLGMKTGGKVAGTSITNIFVSKKKRAERRSRMLTEQADYLVTEMGKLKGSVVKVGQMMALYGEHFLPEEVTEALHRLESDTGAVDWSLVEPVLLDEIGAERVANLQPEQDPLGSASLGQVHKAQLTSGEDICLKVQYPGVASAIDSDIDAFAKLLFMGKIVPNSEEFDHWLDEVRTMLHREVDYPLEATTTIAFAERLHHDQRFVVPKIYEDYSSEHVICSSFEEGLTPTADEVLALSQERRDRLGLASLELFFNEFFDWHELQTDPNFGNYRIRINENGEDQLILLDFGAVREFDPQFLEAFYELMRGSFLNSVDRVADAAKALTLFDEKTPRKVFESFTNFTHLVFEPFRAPNIDPGAPAEALNAKGEYCWGRSDLPKRASKTMAKAAISRNFRVPPPEFIFLNRKLVGVYTMLSVLDAQFDAGDMLRARLGI